MKNISLIRSLIFLFVYTFLSTSLFGQKIDYKKQIWESTDFRTKNAGTVFSHDLEFKYYYPSTIDTLGSPNAIVRYIQDSTDVISKFEKILKENYPKYSKNQVSLILWIDALTKSKKQKLLSGFLIVVKPFSLNYDLIPKSRIHHIKPEFDIICIGPNSTSTDSSNILLKSYWNSNDKRRQLNEVFTEELAAKEKKIADSKDKILLSDSLDVINIIQQSITANELNENNCKTGVVLQKSSSCLKSLNFGIRKNNTWFNNTWTQALGYNQITYQGSIVPITGVLKCSSINQRSGSFYTEHIIENGIVTKLKIAKLCDGYILDEFVINFGDTSNVWTMSSGYNKISDYDTEYNNCYSREPLYKTMHREGKVITDTIYRKYILSNIFNLNNHFQVYQEYKKTPDFIYSIERDAKVLYWKINFGYIIRKNTSRDITDEIIKSTNILKRDSPITYSNSESKKFEYTYSSFTKNDSVSIISRINNLEGGKKYLENITLNNAYEYVKIYKPGEKKKCSVCENHWFENSQIDSSFSDFEIFKQSHSNITKHNTMQVSSKRLSDTTYNLHYSFNKKKMFEGKMHTKGRLIGEAKIYSVSSLPMKDLWYTQKDKAPNSDKFWKFSISFLEPKNEYTILLNNAIDWSWNNPNEKKTTARHLLYLNMLPFATTPFGTEVQINGSPAFLDKTPDHLAERAYFGKNGELEVLYIYLPDGSIYDSLNIRKNEYGEQIGKSTTNEFPFSDSYISLNNASQKETEAKQQEAMFKALKSIQQSRNTCSHCNKQIGETRIDKYDMDCPNGKSYIISLRAFCSLKCHSEYKKLWCDLQ